MSDSAGLGDDQEAESSHVADQERGCAGSPSKNQKQMLRTRSGVKGTDRVRMLGAVVGKALGRPSEGEGVIEVLLTLQ